MTTVFVHFLPGEQYVLKATTEPVWEDADMNDFDEVVKTVEVSLRESFAKKLLGWPGNGYFEDGADAYDLLAGELDDESVLDIEPEWLDDDPGEPDSHEDDGDEDDEDDEEDDGEDEED